MEEIKEEIVLKNDAIYTLESPKNKRKNAERLQNNEKQNKTKRKIKIL